MPSSPFTSLPATVFVQGGVKWFAHSARLVAGRPDALYGWWERPEGLCIVKALDVQHLGPSIATLLDHERHVLAELGRRGAPVPQLVTVSEPGWLVTRFAGLSLQLLQDLGLLDVEELLSAWVHLLRRARAFVEAGALPIDLYAANVVVPLRQELSGQPMLQDLLVIDHAHTVVPGKGLRRPVLIGTSMERIPPELRKALKADQTRFKEALRAAGLPLPQTTAAVRLGDASASFWTHYDAEQDVQQLLDNGRLDVAAAIQFSVGAALRHGLHQAGAAHWQQKLDNSLARLTAEDPMQRYPGLEAAAQALERALPSIARAGRQHVERVTPALLASRMREQPQQPPQPGPAGPPGTASAGEPATTASSPQSRQPYTQCAADALPHWVFPWRLAAIASSLGAVTGAGLKLAGIGL